MILYYYNTVKRAIKLAKPSSLCRPSEKFKYLRRKYVNTDKGGKGMKKATSSEEQQNNKVKETSKFYDRHIFKMGYGRNLAISKVIPKNWEYVRISKIAETENSVTVLIQKLMDSEQSARINKTN